VNALLHFERRAEDEEEAGGDLRWYVTEDGEFFHARRDGDFRLARRFSPAQVARLRDAVAEAGLASLPPAEPPDEGVIEERWTARGETYVVYDTDEEPAAIRNLRELVDQCLAESRANG
jgi:hypothetical protein